MATLVFDIETVPMDINRLDELQREFLFRELERIPNEEERRIRRLEIERQMSLWPLTAQVVCIAMINAETEKGMVLYVSQDTAQGPSPDPAVEFVPCRDEAEMLMRFWDIAEHYDQVVTFNGRAFDVPFLYLRSAILNVQITRKDWLGPRYEAQPHCDLIDQLTFFGLGGREGATKRFNLDFYCKVFGIQSPKSRGITGYDVPRLVREGRIREVAEYCLMDVKATVQLYRIWKERLSGIR